MWLIDIVCETPECSNNGKVINTISDIESENDAQSIMEDTDAEPEDYCGCCNQPGIKREPRSE